MSDGELPGMDSTSQPGLSPGRRTVVHGAWLRAVQHRLRAQMAQARILILLLKFSWRRYARRRLATMAMPPGATSHSNGGESAR